MDIWSADDNSPFCQVAIDARRLRILSTLWDRWKKKQDDEAPLKVCHVWYKKPDAKQYELRQGAAPPDDERPSHLKHKNLDIDLGAVLEKTMRVLRDSKGKTAHDVSIAIAKINGITLPAFSANHVRAKEVAEPVASTLARPTAAELKKYSGGFV